VPYLTRPPLLVRCHIYGTASDGWYQVRLAHVF
jgi:hypothetical protein